MALPNEILMMIASRLQSHTDLRNFDEACGLGLLEDPAELKKDLRRAMKTKQRHLIRAVVLRCAKDYVPGETTYAFVEEMLTLKCPQARVLIAMTLDEKVLKADAFNYLAVRIAVKYNKPAAIKAMMWLPGVDKITYWQGAFDMCAYHDRRKMAIYLLSDDFRVLVTRCRMHWFMTPHQTNYAGRAGIPRNLWIKYRHV